MTRLIDRIKVGDVLAHRNPEQPLVEVIFIDPRIKEMGAIVARAIDCPSDIYSYDANGIYNTQHSGLDLVIPSRTATGHVAMFADGTLGRTVYTDDEKATRQSREDIIGWATVTVTEGVDA